MVLLRHLSAWSQSRRDAAIPLCRRRDRRRGVSLESDLAGAGGGRRFGGGWRPRRPKGARPVLAGAVCPVLLPCSFVVFLVGCAAVVCCGAPAGGPRGFRRGAG